VAPRPPGKGTMTRRERRRPESDERRTHRRVPARDLPTLAAHISGGARVTLLDVSHGGVRLETTRHMRPGQHVSVRFSVEDRVLTMNARVVRAAVVRLHPEEVRYETGLHLVDELSCDQLQVALVERRGSAGDGPNLGVDRDDDVVFTHVTDGHATEGASRGWWLAGKRHRRRRVLQGY
jgi:hypothetical protein